MNTRIPEAPAASDLRPSVPGAGSVHSRRAIVYYLVALLPMLALFVQHWSYLPRLESTDFAQYFMQAESFLRGDGIMASKYLFTDRNAIFGPPAYPPGFPWTLVPLIGVFGPSLAAAKVLMLVFAILFVLLGGAYFGAREGVWTGVAVTGVLGVALEASFATHAPQSDLGFCVFVWAMILLADGKREWSWGRVAAITLAGLAAITYRTAGVVLVPAMFLFALANWRDVGKRALVPVAVWVPVIVGGLSVIGDSLTSAGTSFLPQFARYRLAIFHAQLYPFTSNLANDVYHVVASALLLVGLVAWIKRYGARSFLLIVSVLYVLMLAFVAAADDRYMWPVFPLAVFGLVNGARVLVRRLRPHASASRVEQVSATGAMALALAATITASTEPRPPSLLGLDDAQSLFAHVRAFEHDGSSRVLFANARVMAWQTDVPTMPLFSGTPGEIVGELRRHRITHVVTGDVGISSASNAQLEGVIRAMPRAFVPEFRNPTFTLYRFVDRQ